MILASFFSFTLLAISSLLASLAVASSQNQTVATKLEFTVHVLTEYPHPHEIPITEGVRTSSAILAGNLTGSDGKAIAKIVPGIGGDHGWFDRLGVAHVDLRFNVIFPDGAWGYYQLSGYAQPPVIPRMSAFATLSTNSTKYNHFNNQVFFGGAHIVVEDGDYWFIGPNYSFPL